MYTISNEVLELFLRQYRQTAKITLTDSNGKAITITENDIMNGGMNIDRYSTSGDKLEIGTVIASELTLKLDNRDGRFNNVAFEGAELCVNVGIKKWDAARWENAQIHYVPMGCFTVDEPPRKLHSIAISALDNMVKFDKNVDDSALNFPITAASLLAKACEQCGVNLETDTSKLPNSNYEITECPDTDNLTWRMMIRWLAEIMGCCAFINRGGALQLSWYGSDPVFSVKPKHRFTSDIYENDIAITGVRMRDTDGGIHVAGSDDYALEIVDNRLIQHDADAVLGAVWLAVKGTKYRPYSCAAVSLPHIAPLDGIAYTDAKGITHNTIVTHWNYKLNGRTTLSAKGRTSVKESYAKGSPLTPSQDEVLSKMKKKTEAELTSREKAVLAFNETIAGSLGLHISKVTLDDGSTVYYYHNKTTLAASSVIYTFREGGFAWTDDWNNGNPVWQYGFGRNGNAILNAISAYKIHTDDLAAGSVTAEKLSVEYKNSLANDMDNLESSIRQEFNVTAGKLSSRITETELENLRLGRKITDAETRIEQNAAQIALSATREELDELSGTMRSQASLIQQNASQIALKVSRSEFNELSNTVSSNASSINLLNNQISLVVTEESGTDVINAAAIVAGINNSSSYVKISADHVDIDGIVTIGGWTVGDYYLKYTNRYGDLKALLCPGGYDRDVTLGGGEYPCVALKIGENFGVTNDGWLFCSSGLIGGCRIDSSGKLQVPSAQITGTLTAGALLVKDALGSVIFNADSDERMVKIGGWNVDSDSLSYSLYSGGALKTIYISASVPKVETRYVKSGSNGVKAISALRDGYLYVDVRKTYGSQHVIPICTCQKDDMTSYTVYVDDSSGMPVLMVTDMDPYSLN